MLRCNVPRVATTSTPRIPVKVLEMATASSVSSSATRLEICSEVCSAAAIVTVLI